MDYSNPISGVQVQNNSIIDAGGGAMVLCHGSLYTVSLDDWMIG
jgi:hypothetical protein